MIIIINIFYLLLFYFYFLIYLFLFLIFVFFYLPWRPKVWIELLDLSDSLKYFIPSESISLSIPNIYKKNGVDNIAFDYYDPFFCFLVYYSKDTKFGLNCWIWVIHLNISFLLSQFYCLFQIFIQKKD